MARKKKETKLKKDFSKKSGEIKKPKAQKPARKKDDLLHNGVLETDAVKIAAAADVIKLVLDREVSEVPDELVAKAGRKALANHHMFNLYRDEEGMVSVSATSIDYYQKYKEADQRMGLVNALLPDDCGELAECTWGFNSNKTVAEAAKELRDLGFVWNETWQKSSDPSLIKEISEVYVTAAPAASHKAPFKNRPGYR